MYSLNISEDAGNSIGTLSTNGAVSMIGINQRAFPDSCPVKNSIVIVHNGAIKFMQIKLILMLKSISEEVGDTLSRRANNNHRIVTICVIVNDVRSGDPPLFITR